ncbi:ABC transporter permease [Rhabdobacter roseus]|uniref:Lipoprotein-releasing system permease protein n=1 Tax=Rhabdobacter roseus TaxID=1655419 RepID=A0A840TNQ3_9BACT|nr:ABC transporter permease [Rhabdobacter roseus]MBB5285341.1 lipoprotein-releasing system permease protein [Rhabdobacter roseus]
MDLKIAYTIAQTHLLSKKKQTLVAMLGVTFGIAMFIVMISFMQGVNQFLEDSALDASPHVRIYKQLTSDRPSLIETLRPDGFNVIHHQKPKQELAKIKNGLVIARHIEAQPQVLGVSPQVSTQVFFNVGSVPIPGTLAGVDVLREEKLYRLSQRMKSGNIEDLRANANGVILGRLLARKLNLKVGDKVNVTSSTGGTALLRVVGVFSFGIQTVDDARGYVNMPKVQELIQKDANYITDLHIKMKDPLQAIDFGKQLARQYDYKVEDWAAANQAILAGEQIRGVMTFVVSFTLLVVAGFGIYNIMNMNVINKMKDIAILKATGFNGRDVVAVFLIQSMIIGLLGAILGVTIGFSLSYLLSVTPFDSGDFLAIDTFPVKFDVGYYLLGVAFGVITTVLAGYFPSKKAAKIDPVAVLRG